MSLVISSQLKPHYICKFCPKRSMSEEGIRAHMLYYHLFLMPTCSTGLAEKRIFQGLGDFRKAHNKRVVEMKRTAKRNGYNIRLRIWQDWIRGIKNIEKAN